MFAPPRRLAALLVLGALAGCSAPAPTMTPQQLCAKTEPIAEAWRVADGQDAATPERAAAAMEGCIKHWTEQQAADPALFARITACAAPVTKLEEFEKCVIDNIPVQ